MQGLQEDVVTIKHASFISSWSEVLNLCRKLWKFGETVRVLPTSTTNGFKGNEFLVSKVCSTFLSSVCVRCKKDETDFIWNIQYL